MILYTLPHSSYATKVAIVIAIKGIEGEFEMRKPPGGLRTDTYRGVIPMCQIPALIDGDLTISESEVISEYLEERFSEPPLLPADPKARARSRFFSRFHDIHLEPRSAISTGRFRSAPAIWR
jgi:glutathione S-transferase